MSYKGFPISNGMNKYIIIAIVLGILIVSGVLYNKFGLKESDRPVTTGQVREVTITAKKDEWRWEPENFEAVQGDKIILTVINEDNYDHGIAIEAFGVSQRIPANGKIVAEFVVTQPGEFPYYCSVPCGEGEIAGKKRGHFDQVGTIHVKSLINKTE